MPPSVRLLGGLQVWSGDRLHRPPLQKPVALLAYLACQDGWVERDVLAFLFWPDADRSRSRTNLRRLVARCRRLPYAAALAVEASRLRWTADSDVRAFRRAIRDGDLEAALSLYDGELLPSANVDGAGEFAAWLDAERASLHEAYRSAALRRARDLERAGRAPAAAEALEALLRSDPLDEEVLQRAMGALSASGRPERALRLFRSFGTRLRRELELEPSEASERLARDLADHAADHAGGDGASAGDPSRPADDAGAAVPAPATPFVGREAERSEVARLLALPECRLITLTGTGGVGKTRLAQQAARDWAEHRSGGVVYVALESVASVSDVPLAIGAGLGVPVHPEGDTLAQLARAIGERRLLLVLDNFEHLIEGAALATDLLARCANLRILVTSRERLGASEEWLLPLEGLSRPEHEPSLEEGRRYDAVRFFAERVRQVTPGFRLDEGTLGPVLRICRSVDGLPLGLELAAAWTRALPLADIASEIEGGLDFLRRSRHAASGRHQSVRAVFDHSWKLLTDEERRVLGRLAVFRGGFRRGAANRVTGASIGTLAALVDRSLLRVSRDGRYDRHPLLLQFTLEQLRRSPGEEAEARQRHAEYYAALLAEAAPHRGTPRQEAWRDRLEPERDNLLAALAWTADSEQPELGFRLAAAMHWLWWPGGRVAERRALLERLLAMPTPERTRARADALVVAGVLAHLQGEYRAAEAMYREGLAITREDDAPETAARLLTNLAHLARMRGDLGAARSLLEESLARRREAAGQAGVANTLNNLGTLARLEGDLATARDLHEEALAIGRTIDDPLDVAQSLNGLAYVARAEGDDERAEGLLEESLAVSRGADVYSSSAASLIALGRLAHDRGEHELARSLHAAGLELQARHGMRRLLDPSLLAIAGLLASAGDPERAARLWGAAEAFREARATRLAPDERARHEREVADARARLGGPRFDAAWAEGRALDAVDAVEYALAALEDA